MNKNEIMAAYEDMGKIVRNFKFALQKFVSESNEHTAQIRSQLKNNGFYGGDVNEAAKQTINNNITNLEKQTEMFTDLADRLEQKAVQYDKFLAVLRGVSEGDGVK